MLPRSQHISRNATIALSLILVLLVVLIGGMAVKNASAASLTTYPAPTGATLNSTYTVRVRPSGGSWVDQSEYDVVVDFHTLTHAAYVYFDFSGTVDVEVTYNGGAVTSAQVRPVSYGITPTINGNIITFSLTQPRKVVVQVNGNGLNALHIFGNALETNVPSPTDPNVIYFGPGLYDANNTNGGVIQTKTFESCNPAGQQISRQYIQIPSGKTLYIAGGAVVRAHLLVDTASNVTIRGRGVVDQTQWVSSSPRVCTQGLIIRFSSNVAVDGIIFADPNSYVILGGTSTGVTITNIKAFTALEWADGIDTMGVSDMMIDDVFLRTSDDSIAIYGNRWEFTGNSHNITVQNSTLWADRAHPMFMGCHGDYAGNGNILEQITFKNIDVLEMDEPDANYQGVMGIVVGDKNTARDIRYEDIRIEDFSRGSLLDFRVNQNGAYNPAPGQRIENVYVKNVSYNGSGESPSKISGWDASRIVTGITFDNLRINGNLVTTAAGGNITVGSYTSNITFINGGPTPTSVKTPTVAPTVAPTPTPTQSPNGVVNPGLETGALAPWTAWNVASVVNTNARTGTYALQIGASPASAEQVVSGLTVNRAYVLGGWAKVATAGESIKIGVKNYGGVDSGIEVTVTGYTPVTVNFTTGASNTSATIYCYKVSAAGYGYCDDFSVFPASNPPTPTSTPGGPTPTITNTPVPPTATNTPTITNTPVPPTATKTNTPTATKTNTPVGPTSTSTNTPVPPTATKTYTPVPATATKTNTPVPPTATRTYTPVPPTATKTNTPVPGTPTNTPVPATVGNPGFETGSISPWANPEGTASVVNNNAHSGTYAGQLAPGASVNLEQIVTGLTSNTRYILTGWAKVAIGGEQVYIGVKDFGGTETSQPVAVTGYTQVTIAFTTGASNTQAKIYCWRGGGSGNAYCDDFSLAVAPNLVVNPGLETGALAPWTAWNDATVVNTNARTGTYVLRIGASPASAEQLVSGLTVNTAYILKGWAKVATAGESIKIGVKNYGGVDSGFEVTVTGYTQVTVNFTTGGANTSAAIYCYKVSAAGYGYCDDFSLTR